MRIARATKIFSRRNSAMEEKKQDTARSLSLSLSLSLSSTFLNALL
jgi:hypothetical protein